MLTSVYKDRSDDYNALLNIYSI